MLLTDLKVGIGSKVDRVVVIKSKSALGFFPRFRPYYSASSTSRSIPSANRVRYSYFDSMSACIHSFESRNRLQGRPSDGE